MNIKEYIESGNLEAYLLGALSAEEETKVAADIAMYPELAIELVFIEEAMFRFAVSEAITPPAHLKEQIWNTIQAAAHELPKPENIAAKATKATVIPLTPPKKQMSWAYAAVWVALIGSSALNVAFWNVQSNQKKENTLIVSQLNAMQAAQDTLGRIVENYAKGKKMMADISMQTIVMHTVLKGHPMAATLYWSKDKAEAYVMMDALPQPPKGMQYQLWAIQGGKPVDMGLLNIGMANTSSIQKVTKQVTAGEAFAISLEKEGGSPSPTVENIYVMGKS